MSLTIGIDPGKTGAIAFLNADGTLLDVVDMPSATGAALGACLRDLIADWAPHTIAAAWIEQVNTRPGQSATAMWTFATNYGAILGALGALGIPCHHVTTPTWRKTSGITIPASVDAKAKKKVGKQMSRQRAMELYVDHTSLFARVKDDGRAEAALIARHGLIVGAL